MPQTLADAAPKEFTSVEYATARALKYKDVRVIAEHDGIKVRWPGPHKHVYLWWTLENGKRVGWNENPTRGWSFPVL